MAPQDEFVAGRGTEDDRREGRRRRTDVERDSVRAEPTFDAVGIAAHAYLPDPDLPGGMVSRRAAREMGSWLPFDEEWQRRLGGSFFDARDSPSDERSAPARSRSALDRQAEP